MLTRVMTHTRHDGMAACFSGRVRSRLTYAIATFNSLLAFQRVERRVAPDLVLAMPDILLISTTRTRA
jgi:hypothetical protein